MGQAFPRVCIPSLGAPPQTQPRWGCTHGSQQCWYQPISLSLEQGLVLSNTLPPTKVSFSRKRSLQRRSVPRQGSRLSIKGVFPRQGSRRQTWTGRSTWDDRDCYLSNYRTEIAISRTCCLQRRSFSPAGFTEADLDRSMSSETHHRRRQRIRENETFVGGKGTLSDTDMAGFTEAGLDPSTSLSLQGRSRSLEYGFQPRSVSPAGFTEADLDRTMSSEIHRRWRQRSL